MVLLKGDKLILKHIEQYNLHSNMVLLKATLLPASLSSMKSFTFQYGTT